MPPLWLKAAGRRHRSLSLRRSVMNTSSALTRRVRCMTSACCSGHVRDAAVGPPCHGAWSGRPRYEQGPVLSCGRRKGGGEPVVSKESAPQVPALEPGGKVGDGVKKPSRRDCQAMPNRRP